MKTAYVVVALLLTAAQICHGGQTHPAFKIPLDSPLVFESAEKMPSYLTFSGKAEIRTEYTFVYHSEAYNLFVELIIEPDCDSVSTLPYLTERKRGEIAGKILVSNTEEAAELLLGSNMARGLFEGKYPSIRGHAVVVIADFVAGYECDEALYPIEVVSTMDDWPRRPARYVE